MRILVVEDEVQLAEAVARGLRREGMAVDVSTDGDDGYRKAALTRYDVVVLDRDLPGMSGDDICRRLADEGVLTRVMMLTASGTVEDKVAGLALGADDYLAKPFAFAELVARVRALGRRTTPAAPPVLTAGDIELDSAKRTVSRDGELDRPHPQGVRRPRDAADGPGRGGQQRGAARPGVGRERRPVHHHGAGDDDDPAPQARRAGDHRHRGRLGIPHRPGRAQLRRRRDCGIVAASEAVPPDAARPHGVAVRRTGPAGRASPCSSPRWCCSTARSPACRSSTPSDR